MIKYILVIALLSPLISNFNIQTNSAPKQQLSVIPWPFTLCGNGTWTVKSLTLASTPARNTNDEIVATGIANDDIQFKQVDLTVKLNGAFLHSETIAFANSYSEGDTVAFKFNNFIPSFAPIGTYGLTFNFTTSAGKPNGCVAFSFKL